MSKNWLLIPAILLLHWCCTKSQRTSNLDIRGRWCLDSLLDKGTGRMYYSLMPADTIILDFYSDTAFGGVTHRTSFTGSYRYDGVGTALLGPTFAYAIADDTLGTNFLNLLRGFWPGNVPPSYPISCSLEFNNGALRFDNTSRYTGWLRRL